MAKKNLQQLNDDNKYQIIKYYKKTKSFDKTLIMSSFLYGIDRNVLLNLLIERELLTPDEVLENAIVEYFDDDCLFIADTHIGSIYERFEYINLVYNYAIQNKIRHIIHAGDVVESTISGNVKSELNDIDLQAQYLIENYPHDYNIMTYFLLGNHDYASYKNSNNFLKIIRSRSDFNILGFKKAYFNWCDKMIAVGHRIDKYHIPVFGYDQFLKFNGHRHSLRIRDNTIYLPTLSDDKKIIDGVLSVPGFTILHKNEELDRAEVNLKSIINDEIVDSGIIKVRKLKGNNNE